MPVSQFFSRATNMSCHNYCSPPSLMPNGTKSVLGNGLKYCIKRPRPPKNIKKTTWDRFKNDVRRTSHFLHNPPEEDGEVRYIPELYIKSDWEPPICQDEEIEDSIKAFESEFNSRRARYLKPTLSKLMPHQWKTIDRLKDNDEFIVIEADKNLGGSILSRDEYISRGVSEHLSDTDVYEPLTKEQVWTKQHCLRYRINVFISKWSSDKYGNVLSYAERHFLLDSVDKYYDSLPKFRMSLKANKVPFKMRPIVCCAGTMLNGLSKWLDYWLQKVKPLLPCYLKDSDELIDMMKALGPLPPGAKLFTADATSMYTNIDTDHAIQVIGDWLDSKIDKLPSNFHLQAVKEAMELVMCNNIFQWGDMYFLQKRGTAMGTSSACMWATIYFAVHEDDTLLTLYNQNLMLFRRFIDDIIGIWIIHEASDEAFGVFQQFKDDVNDFGILKWKFEERSTSVDFLDLTITIENNQLVFKTYQKAFNLYQYISPSSAHPPGMMRGIVYGLMRKYKRQNTNISDYNKMAHLLFKRHVARGWDRATFKEYILAADTKLRNNPPQPTIVAMDTTTVEETTSNRDHLFLHLQYHPRDIPRQMIRTIYNKHCKTLFEERLGINQLTIAYSRPPNIRELLTKAKLYQAPGREASKFYSGELSTT